MKNFLNLIVPFILLTLVVVALVGLTSLGVWQLQRREWKHQLIERVDSRIHANAAAAPGPDLWPQINAGDAYRHVRLRGAFLPRKQTLVEASTALGHGYWVMAPLRADQGYIVFINRGFIPDALRDDPGKYGPPEGEATVTGLLRLTEPHGRPLRPNRPEENRWYSRDVAAIAAGQGLGPVAPYFIDAEAADAASWPRGGLTVVHFADNHLIYALTWFGLALLLAAWTIVAVEQGKRNHAR